MIGLNLKNHWFKTPKGHIVELDDETNAIYITHSSGINLIMNDKGISLLPGDGKVSLGKLDESDEPAVLGNKTEKLINDLIELNSTILSKLEVYAAAESSAATGLSLAPLAAPGTTLVTEIQLIKTQIELIKPEVVKIKSKKITLD